MSEKKFLPSHSIPRKNILLIFRNFFSFTLFCRFWVCGIFPPPLRAWVIDRVNEWCNYSYREWDWFVGKLWSSLISCTYVRTYVLLVLLRAICICYFFCRMLWQQTSLMDGRTDGRNERFDTPPGRSSCKIPYCQNWTLNACSLWMVLQFVAELIVKSPFVVHAWCHFLAALLLADRSFDPYLILLLLLLWS